MNFYLGKAEPIAELVHSMLACHDEETARHCKRVAELSVRAARFHRGCSTDEQLHALYLGALLHDVGKVKIDQAVLRKPSPLTDDEWSRMKTHPVVGAILLSMHPLLECAVPIVRHHHEFWNGTGYPGGLRGDQIPIGSRIIAVADAYDAMVTDRPYRKAFSKLEALNNLWSSIAVQFETASVSAVADAVSEVYSNAA